MREVADLNSVKLPSTVNKYDLNYIIKFDIIIMKNYVLIIL